MTIAKTAVRLRQIADVNAVEARAVPDEAHEEMLDVEVVVATEVPALLASVIAMVPMQEDTVVACTLPLPRLGDLSIVMDTLSEVGLPLPPPPPLLQPTLLPWCV